MCVTILLHAPIFPHSVLAVERLSALGLVVSVAAGNARADACHGSPNAASSAITVGATTADDHVAYFSNTGQCVDLLAPGADIRSATARSLSGQGGDTSEGGYHSLSGTSMAAPHGSGVLALLLQREPALTPQQAVATLLCEAEPGVLHMHALDTLTRNLLLQTPRPWPREGAERGGGPALNSSAPSLQACAALLGGACADLCAQEGVCMPSRHIAATSGKQEEGADQCFCNGGFYGDTCSSSAPADPTCQAEHWHAVAMTMLDSYGDGEEKRREGVELSGQSLLLCIYLSN